jgi:tetratricopeptide (TPR) repeat protein
VASDPVELIQRAVTALQRRAWNEAAELAQTILQQFGPEANALMVLAAVRRETGDLPGAIDLYERARTVNPNHVHVLVNLAAALRAAGRLPEARRTLDAALQVDGRFPIAHNNLGNVLDELGERTEARRAYERAAALEPHYADPLASLARMAEEEHRLEEAGSLAERTLQLAPQNAIAALTLARVRLRQDDASGAIIILEALLRAGTLSATNRIVAEGYLGEACEELGRYPQAFAAFTRANQLQREQHAAVWGEDRGPLAPGSIGRLTAFVAAADVATWSPAPPSVPTPVFLVGFPRSGTTLLDQMLASHPEVETLEERDTLIDAAGELLTGELAHERWAGLSAADIERLRALYWQRVRSAGSRAARKRVFVDKQPMNAVLLPLIYRLFPAAPIVLAVRDPRDVVLSCYQQRFGMNVAMFQLLRLDSATAYYDAVMRLVAVCREKLPLRVQPVRYEDVVADFEGTLRGLLGFLGLEWDEGVRGYTDTARKRAIGTPSAAQVVRPLYGSARGRWRNYRGFLDPYLPTLSGWAAAFGYEAR